MDANRYSHISKNLLSTGTGYYISLNDTRAYEKILQNNFSDGKLLYNAALILEKQADQCLSEYKKTRKNCLYRMYRKRLEEAMSVMRKAWKNGYIYAPKEILRLDEKVNNTPPKVKNKIILGIFNFSSLLFLCFVIGMIIPVLLFFLSNNLHGCPLK